MKKNLLGLFLCAALTCVYATTADGAVILSNLPGTSSGTGTNLGLGPDLGDRTKAVGLTTSTDLLSFQSIEVLLSNPDLNTTVSGGIYSDVGGNPGSLLVSFNPQTVTSGTTNAIFTLTASAPFILSANTTFWFLLDGPNTENSLMWNSLNPNAAPTASGVTFEGYLFSSNGGVSWTASGIANGVRVNAEVYETPEPGTLTLMVPALGLLGLVAWGRKKTAGKAVR